MEDCNPTKVPMDPGTKLHEDKNGQKVDATEYRRIIDCFRYLIHTRPDLAFQLEWQVDTWRSPLLCTCRQLGRSSDT